MKKLAGDPAGFFYLQGTNRTNIKRILYVKGYRVCKKLRLFILLTWPEYTS